MGTNSGNVFTLANSIIGVSVLAMPFCFKQCGIILSIVMLLFSSVISRLACYFLIKSALLEKRKNFEMLAFRVYGPTGKLMVELCIIGFMLGTCVAFFVIMGDLGPAIIGPPLGFDHPSALRPSVLVGVAVFVVLPLGLLRNVDSLNAFCAASILFYICLVLKVLSEAAGNILAGSWIDKVHLWRPSGILQCIPIFSMALSCQTQLFEIFDGILNTPLDRINSAIRAAINMTTVVYISVGLFGYIAYCNQSFSGNVLMSFSPTLWSEVIKLGFILSVAVSFPLVIFPCRASIHSLLFSKSGHGYELVGGSSHIPETRFQCITLVIVTCSLVVGLVMPNIEVVLGLVGSTIGVFICVITPATIFTSLSTKNTNDRLVAQLLVGIGLVIMVLGTYANLSATEDVVREIHLPEIRPEVKLAAPVLQVDVTVAPAKEVHQEDIIKNKLKIKTASPPVELKETEEKIKAGPVLLPIAPDLMSKVETNNVVLNNELLKEQKPVFDVKESVVKLIKDQSRVVNSDAKPMEPVQAIVAATPKAPLILLPKLVNVETKVKEAIKDDAAPVIDSKLEAIVVNSSAVKTDNVKQIIDPRIEIPKRNIVVKERENQADRKEKIIENSNKNSMDNLARSMAEGVPLPLVKGVVKPLLEKKTIKESIDTKPEKVDADIDTKNIERSLLEKIESREKRNTDVEIEKEKLEMNVETDVPIIDKQLSAVDGVKLKDNDNDNCPRPSVESMVDVNHDATLTSEPEKTEDNLIKSPAKLTEPEHELDTDPKLVPDSQIDAANNAMPKKRDLKSLGDSGKK